MAQQHSDAELIRRAARGDGAAFDLLHARHYRCVLALLRRAGLAEEDAADVSQEVFVRAYRFAGGFDPARGAFAAWLATIARNCLARHFSRAGQPQSLDPAFFAEGLAQPGDGPAESLAAAEEASAVGDCVSRLPAELRRIVELRYAGGQTTRAIAATTALSESSVRNRLQEARELLARCLGGKGVL